MALALIAGAAQAAPASDPQALRLMQQCKAATGGSALDLPEAFRETGAIDHGGRVDPYETFGDLHSLRYASQHSMDGKQLRAGFDGVTVWNVGLDGQVLIARDAPTLRGERLGTWMTLSGYLYPDRFPASYQYIGRRRLRGRPYDVVLATPADADPVQLWLDPTTHRVAHIDAATKDGRIVGDISDYRLVSGTWVGFAIDVLQAGQLTHLRIGSFSYIPLSQAQLAPPAGA